MRLKEFEFIEEATSILAEQRPALEVIEDELVKFFASIPLNDTELIAVTSRIKSENSLKEKIIRNRYLSTYSEPKELISDIPDLIGIRMECKFTKEEKDIFLILKKYFKCTDDRKYFYSKSNKNIRLYLYDKQPLRQKNGFEIYKIDGEYTFLNRRIKFELQIKSLVNVFWSEIEHKIIYKNTTYLLEDAFLKDMMVSIKNSLTMIDDQLLNIYTNFKSKDKIDGNTGRVEMEKIFAKILYDTIMYKMKKQLYFSIDFKKPCETIISYSMNKYSDSLEGLSNFLTDEYSKINDFINKDIDFDNEIHMENEVVFEDEFSQNVANFFLKKMNSEVPWNLFFKIIFELEPENNVDDFMNFIKFFKASLVSEESIYNTIEKYGEYSNKIISDLYECIYKMIEKVGRIDIFYDNNIEKINKLASEGLDYVSYEFDTYFDYMEMKRVISKTITDSLIKIF